MNRPLFIIIGSVVILILLLVWVYVLFIRDNFTSDNNTGNSDTFLNIKLDDTSIDPGLGNSDQNDDGFNSSTTDSEQRKKLRQLTTKKVAGFSEINASSSDVAYFIEAGVGHVYEIDIFTGQERRISATTFPDTYLGDVSSNGKYFAIQTGYSDTRTTHIGTIEIETQSLSTKELERGIVSLAFFSDSTLGYAVMGTQNIVVKHYDFETGESKQLFTVPFREASIVWGTADNDPHYFFPKPAAGLEGFLYKYENGGLQREPLDGFNFTAYGSKNIAVATYESDSKFQTTIYNRATKMISSVPVKILPSKCLETRDEQLICGLDRATSLEQFNLTQWQKGLHQFNDDLHSIDLTNGSVNELINTTEITGRVADMIKLEQGFKYDYVYFINKNDQTLWIYEHEAVQETVDTEE